MKIRIIKNFPLEDGASDISRHIGSIFEVTNEQENGNIYIDDGEGDELMLYKGEYEVVKE